MAKNGRNAMQCNAMQCPCKILTLGPKIKLLQTYEKPFYKHIKAVLCKTPHQKTANIREMKAF